MSEDDKTVVVDDATVWARLAEARAANRQLLQMNDELRAAGEALQVSLIEMQSVNEQLTTLNKMLAANLEARVRAEALVTDLLRDPEWLHEMREILRLIFAAAKDA